MSLPAHPSCAGCRHLDNSAAAVEHALPGLTSLSSAYAAVRADDGLCCVHQRYVAATSICSRHAARWSAAARVQARRATSTRQS